LSDLTEGDEMARLSQPARDAFDDPAELADYDAVVARATAMQFAQEDDPALGAPDLGEYFGALLNSPGLCALASRMGTFVRTAGEHPDSYSHADREFVDQVLSADWKTNLVLASHIPDALASGVRMEAIVALRSGHEELLDDHERLLARFIRQLVDGTVDDDTFAAMRDRLGTRGLVDLAGFVLWFQWIIRMMQMLRVSEPSDAEIDALIAGLRAGTIPLPDFRERLR
jgi:hypothetical protein